MLIIIFLLFSCMFLLDILSDQTEIVLHPRDTNETTFLLTLVFTGTVFVAISRLTNPNLFELVSNNFFRFKSIDKSYSEDLRLGILSRIMMSLNFIFSLSLCFYLLFQNIRFDSTILGITILIATFYFTNIVWGHNLIRLFNDSSYLMENLSFNGRSYINFVGLFLLSFSLIWILNPGLNNILLITFFIVMSFLHMIRIFKGLNFSFQLKIKWYYLILYLCTVEILPIMVLGKVLVNKL